MNASRTSRIRALLGASATLIALIAVLIGPAGAPAAPGDADLALTKTDSPDPVTVDGALTYTVTVQNLGPLAATGVVVTDTLPSNVDFVSATASTGTCSQAGGTVTCTIGTVNAATSVTVTIVVTPKRTGTLSNTASVTSPEDNTPANNSDTETTTVNKAADAGKGKGKGKKNKASCAAATISGTPGNDTIVGTDKNDVINTGGGDDQVVALDGKDVVCTGPGSDFVLAGEKNDTVIGGAKADRLIGEAGDDTIKGKRGRDRLRGRAGNDFMHGGRGPDSCKGGPGNDTERSC